MMKTISCLFLLVSILLTHSYNIRMSPKVRAGLKAEDVNFIENLPIPLKRQEDRATLIKWYSRLRGLNEIQKTVPISLVAEKTKLSIKSVRYLTRLFGKLEEILLSVNMRLVLSVALQHVDKGLELDDLVYEGVRGLKRAAEKFDLSKGVAFSTYAYPWIQVYVKAALAKANPIDLPRHVYQLHIKVRAVTKRMYVENNYRYPTDEELANELGITMERFDIVRKARALVDRSIGSDPVSSQESPAPFDESTWELTTMGLEGSLLENVQSQMEQPTRTSMNSFLSQTLAGALQTLPIEESKAILSKLKLAKETKKRIYLDASERVHYHKGVRRLKRKVSSGTILQDNPYLTA